MNKIAGFFGKEYNKFKRQRWYGKIFDLLFIVLLILLLIPSTRKQVMTYASKVRMYLTSVEQKESATPLNGAESLVFRDSSGQRHRLSEYLDKPVFINYWATWCPPCRAEMPTLEKLYQQYGQDIHFLFISGQQMQKQQSYLNQNGYSLPSYQLLSRPGGNLNYSVLPTSLIISKDNRIILRKEGAVNWQSRKVQQIFEKVGGR